MNLSFSRAEVFVPMFAAPVFAAWKKKRQTRAQRSALYAALVRQTRQPDFYRALGVPDSFDGRFDLLVLHAYLLFRRLRALGGEGPDLAQGVFDTMFADMDGVLREMGVGDLSVGRKIRAMAEAFYGRVKAYDEAMAADDKALAAALTRNVFGDTGAPDQSMRLVAYVRAAELALGQASFEALRRATLPFPAPMLAGQEKGEA